jgi:hypothetical protein
MQTKCGTESLSNCSNARELVLSRRAGHVALAPIIVAVAVASASTAVADPFHPTEQEKASARPLATEGLGLAANGDCRGAIEKLTKSEALVHAPSTSVALAQCNIAQGRVIAGIEILTRVINEPLAPDAPQPFVEARQRAQPMRDAAQTRVAKLRIHVEGAGPPGSLQVMLDGQSINPGWLDQDLPVDPTAHHVVVKENAQTAEADVSLGDGQARTVSLNLIAPQPPSAVGYGAYGLPPPAGYGQPPAPPGAVPSAGFGQPPPAGQGQAPPPSSYGQPAPGQTLPPGYGSPPAGGSASPSGGAPPLDDGSPWTAFEFGARLAFGLPFGGLSGATDDNLDHLAKNQIAPLWLDAGFRIASHWYVGGYFAYGLISLADQLSKGTCDQPGISCSSNDTRFGVNAHYHALPDGKVDPWFGAGFGYEWLSATFGGNGITRSTGVDGWEFFNAQAGVDFRLLEGTLGVGPFLAVTVDQYSNQSAPSDNHGGTTSSSINNQGLHEWLLFGVRGSYDVKFK